jgi:thioredoxin reductase
MYDAIIIGGGFAGTSAALQLARARRKVLLLDSGNGRNRSADAAHGFYGHDGKAPSALRLEARAQLAKYQTVRMLDELAIGARKLEDGFEVVIGNGAIERAARLILASGVHDELPDLAGLRERWGQTVVHCPYCHGYELATGPLGVLETGEMSAHQAILVSDWGPVTYFGKPPAPEHAAHFAEKGIVIEQTPIAEILGSAPALEGVRLLEGREIELVGLFVGSRTSITTPIVKELGCEIDESPMGAVIKVDALKQTSVPGVFAVGDVSAPFGNSVMAAAAGALAGVATHRSLVFGV